MSGSTPITCANVAYVRQSRPDSGFGFQVEVSQKNDLFHLRSAEEAVVYEAQLSGSTPITCASHISILPVEFEYEFVYAIVI